LNLLHLRDVVDVVLDDDLAKRGMFLPGARHLVTESAALEDESIVLAICVARRRTECARAASAFPESRRSIQIDFSRQSAGVKPFKVEQLSQLFAEPCFQISRNNWDNCSTLQKTSRP
jgi:hypothetical protein